jgi:serine/threonine protein kinase
MSPEQVRGLAVDERSDLFGVGALMYEMLAGRRAFTGQTPSDVWWPCSSTGRNRSLAIGPR